ncbi:MAG: ABC transporter permease [Planctomycetota bacterium]|jgi:putative ABC transport system permease protein|nr:ABC transporter permease [Planctomycetota bacterium]
MGLRAGKRRIWLKMLSASLLRRRSRVIAALAAITIGATVLSGMLSVYWDIPRQLEREFRSYGANLVLVPSGEVGVMGLRAMRRAASLLPADRVIGVTPYRYETLSINRQPFTAAGTYLDEARRTNPYWRLEGEWPASDEEMLMGADAAGHIGAAPGTRVRVSGRGRNNRPFAGEMTISGLVRSGGPEDAMLFMEMSMLESLTGTRGEANLVDISVAGSEGELRKMADASRESVTSVTPRLLRRVVGSETAVLAKLRYLVFLVTVVALALIFICVATGMLTSVMERSREIGLKKALGADNAAIMGEFLGEGAVLGIAGGLLGSFAGYFFAQLIGISVFGRSAAFEPLTIPAAVAVSVLTTALAALPPVRRAADIEPAVVLRGE